MDWSESLIAARKLLAQYEDAMNTGNRQHAADVAELAAGRVDELFEAAGGKREIEFGNQPRA